MVVEDFEDALRILSTKDMRGKFRFFNEDFILRLSNKLGWTVAHAQAKRGWTTQDESIVRMATTKGYTVAHAMAFRGYVFRFERINKLATLAGWLGVNDKSGFPPPITVENIGSLVTKNYLGIKKQRRTDVGL